MDLTALLFWPDERGAHLLERLLDEVAITTEWCADPADASSRLLLRRFDCAVVDCAQPAGLSLLSELSASADHKSAIKIGLLDLATALRMFQPRRQPRTLSAVALDRARNTLRVARALMRHEKRRTRRVGVAENVIMEINGERRQAFLADISEGGMAMISTKSLARTEKIRLLFALPNSSVIMNLTGEIVSRTAEGRYGIRFVDMSHQIRKALREWILERIHALRPEPIAPIVQTPVLVVPGPQAVAAAHS